MKRDVSVYPYSELNNSILTGELGMGGGRQFRPRGGLDKDLRTVVHVLEQRSRLDHRSRASGHRHSTRMLWRRRRRRKRPGPTSGSKTTNIPRPRDAEPCRANSIQDSGNPNASNAGIWVGLEEPPTTARRIRFPELVQAVPVLDADGCRREFHPRQCPAGAELHPVGLRPGGGGHLSFAKPTGGESSSGMRCPDAAFRGQGNGRRMTNTRDSQVDADPGGLDGL